MNACTNCGNFDFLDDVPSGNILCATCGLVQDILFSDARPYSEIFDCYGGKKPRILEKNTPLLGNGLPRLDYVHYSAPYAEGTYLNERIAQWRLVEPPIPTKDWRAIERAFKKLHGSVQPDTISKDEIRRILADIDAQRVARGKKRRFIRKYLEKWLSIRANLTGHKSRGVYAPSWLVNNIRERFAQLLVPFKKLVKGNGRYSVINLNFTFRRLLDLEGMSWYAVDFPPLKTPAKRKKLVYMWVDCCKQTGWPYINTDQITFPHIKFYRPQSWLEIFQDNGGKYRSPNKRRKRQRASDGDRLAKRLDRWVRTKYGDWK